MSSPDPSVPCPDGIEDRHARPTALQRHASPVALIVLGLLIALAFAGAFGGGPASVRSADTADVLLVVKSPRILRNGVFYETRIGITAKRDVAKLTLAIMPSLWRDITINAMVPQASEERYDKGAFRFDYGALKAGERLEVKVDGQINPPLFAGTEGTVAVLDGERTLARVPLSMRVLP